MKRCKSQRVAFLLFFGGEEARPTKLIFYETRQNVNSWTQPMQGSSVDVKMIYALVPKYGKPHHKKKRKSSDNVTSFWG